MYLSLPEDSRDSFSTFKQNVQQKAITFYDLQDHTPVDLITGRTIMLPIINTFNQKPLIRNKSDSAPTASGIIGEVHICHDNAFNSLKKRNSPNDITRGYYCRENFEKHYCRKFVTDKLDTLL